MILEDDKKLIRVKSELKEKIFIRNIEKYLNRDFDINISENYAIIKERFENKK